MQSKENQKGILSSTLKYFKKGKTKLLHRILGYYVILSEYEVLILTKVC